jgi:uncharacterized paraquat-inducible protein A
MKTKEKTMMIRKAREAKMMRNYYIGLYLSIIEISQASNHQHN